MEYPYYPPPEEKKEEEKPLKKKKTKKKKKEESESEKEEPVLTDTDVEVFDVYHQGEEQMRDYQEIKDELDNNNRTYKEKVLKRAVIYDNQMNPEVEEKMIKKGERYCDE